MPPLFGLLAGRAGLQLLPFYLTIFLVLMIILLEKTYRAVSKENVVTP